MRRTKGRVQGWISYTLSRSARNYSCGLRPPDYDQTHVLNVVVQAHLPWKLLVGAHLNVSSGRPFTQLQTPDPFVPTIVADRNNARLPAYVQLDLRIDREWTFARWSLGAFVEVLNATFSQIILNVGYPKDPATGFVRYDQPHPNGFNWILPSVGLRARF